MLLLSPILSGIFVAIVLATAGNCEDHRKSKVVGLAFLGIPGGIFLCQSLPLALNALLVFLVAVGGMFGGCSPRAFRRHIWMATVASYLIMSVFAINQMRDIPRLRERYPLESMAERLAYESQGPSANRLGQPFLDQPELRLSDRFELEVAHNQLGWNPFSFNSAAPLDLEDLHKGYVHHFIDSPGFGVGRMIRPSYRRLNRSFIREPPEEKPHTLPPPAYDDPSREKDYRDPWAAGSTTAAAVAGRVVFGKLHLDSLLDFVNQGHFGYIRDRTQVAGFVPHRFREMPRMPSGTAWQLDTLELISLLKHAEPVAYVSRELPRMDKLRDAPVRPLTEHERAMLDGLRRGEDLQVRSISDRLRMLGAIRAAEQCLRCHEVERGTLLGAFSYKLRLEQ